MNDTAISIKNLSKKYQLGNSRYGTLRHTLANLFKSSKKEEFWALDDLSVEIKRGESIGLIGRNGAGKSTLLKILSKITYPTSGSATLYGKIASLLEVGTGFHAELSGRENIFLNGSLLGMTKREIKGKFEQIVEFSGIGKFIDTPVKHYSSGMYVRLAFSVAAHLDSDILLVDEVLAVGDFEFQQKCIQKLNSDLGKKTVLFVSHDLKTIEKLCNKCIWIENGKIKEFSSSHNVISAYKNIGNHSHVKRKSGNLKAFVKLIDNSVAISNSRHTLKFKIENNTPVLLEGLRLDIGIDDKYGNRIGWLTNENKRCDLKGQESITLEFAIENWVYKTGKYLLTTYLENEDGLIEQCKNIEIIDSQSDSSNFQILPPEGQGNILLNYKTHYS